MPRKKRFPDELMIEAVERTGAEDMPTMHQSDSNFTAQPYTRTKKYSLPEAQRIDQRRQQKEMRRLKAKTKAGRGE